MQAVLRRALLALAAMLALVLGPGGAPGAFGPAAAGAHHDEIAIVVGGNGDHHRNERHTGDEGNNGDGGGIVIGVGPIVIEIGF